MQEHGATKAQRIQEPQTLLNPKASMKGVDSCSFVYMKLERIRDNFVLFRILMGSQKP